MTFKTGLTGALLAVIGASLSAGAGTHAATVEEFRQQRFGTGNWTYAEMMQLQRDNTKNTNLEKYAKKGPAGDITWEDVPHETMYIDAELGKQLGKAFYEAMVWRQRHGVTDTGSSRAGDEMLSNGLKYKMNKLEDSMNKIAAKGTPNTLHGAMAQVTETKIEHGQVFSICKGRNGENAEEMDDGIYLVCDETDDGAKRVATTNAVMDIKGNGRGSTTYTRNHEHYADRFSIDEVKNEGDIYNIDNQDNGVVDVHARGSKVNAGAVEAN